MSSIKSLINQQYGYSKWTSYDSAIKRLRCLKEEQYTQLLPSEDLFCDTPIFACKFAPLNAHEGLVALANEDGKLAIHDTTNKQERYGTRAHNNAVFDLAWMFGQMKIVTASGDHTSKLFDVSNAEIREIKEFTGHSRSVKTVAFRKNDSSVFATGGRDGNIILWDTRADNHSFIGKTDKTIFNSHNIKVTPSKSAKKMPCSLQMMGVKSVTGIVFQNDNTLISCGAGDGIIKVWDLRKSYITYKNEPLPKYKIPYSGSTTKNGFSNLIIDSNCTKLYANCLDNSIYCYNLCSYNPEPIMKYSGHQNNTFYIKSALSSDGQYIISGSSDDNAYIWNTNFSNPLVKLSGHYAEVTCVAWCQNNLDLITCSDDMTHKIWRVGSEFLPENWEVIGKGKAEIFPIPQLNNTSRKRQFDLKLTPQNCELSYKKFLRSCDKCQSPSVGSRFCQNCSESSSKRKRSDDNLYPNKKISTEFGPRRLFSNLTQNAGICTELATILENKDESELEISNKFLDNIKLREVKSPTVDLPNYVIDGLAPHLNFSPPKKKNQDWLTKMRIERKFRRDMECSVLGSPSSSKIPKLELTPKSRINNKFSAGTSGSSSSQSPILRFFKITNSVKCDNQVTSKGINGLNASSPKPRL